MSRWLGWVAAAVRAAGWAPAAVFLTHVIASRGLGTYELLPWLDIPMHLLGGAAIAYFFRRSLRLRQSRPVVGALTDTAAALLACSATGLVTVVWELAEWCSDRLLGTRAQLGLDDTLLDMLLGLVGGILLVSSAAHARPPAGE